MSTTIMADQAAALDRLVKETGAVAVEVADDHSWSLRVATFHARDERAETDPPADAHWWTISCNGVVREVAPTPDPVHA